MSAKVIYGSDSRRDWHEVLDQNLLDLADSTVGIIDKSSVHTNGVNSMLDTRPFNLCTSERFNNQRKGPWCSGFLVAPDIIVTAGHCIETVAECKNVNFVFGYAKKSSSHDPALVKTEDVYGCSELLGQEKTSRGTDWAVIKLDRPVTGHQPLRIRRTGTVARQTPLILIGHPSSLPSKIAKGGRVRDVRSAHFVADLDSYGGNSGSAVFNADTNEVEGILVRGKTDYKYQNGCYVSNVCEDGINGSCTVNGSFIEGEHVTKISEVVHLIPLLTEVENTPIEEVDEEDPIDSDLLVSKVLTPILDDYRETAYSRINNVPKVLNPGSMKIVLALKHTYISDLTVRLIAPDGNSVLLHDRTGDKTNDINGIYGVDFKSAEPLSSLGPQSAGVWVLEIIDHIPYDKGSLIGWGIAL